MNRHQIILTIIVLVMMVFALSSCSSIEDNCTDDGCPSFHELNDE